MTTPLSPAAAVPSLPGRLGDRVLSGMLRLPRATNAYTIERGLQVPMRDGVTLVADHYVPDTARPRGTLLARGPYGRGTPYTVAFARLYAQRGYHVVLQSCRGTFQSGGDFEPMKREVADGADTVAWLRVQPWFTGTFATLGLSYLGFTQWALLMNPPPEMAAAVITVGPHDFSQSSHGTGAFAMNDFLGWSDLMAHQEEGGLVRALARMVTAPRRHAPALSGLPLIEAGELLLKGRSGWYGDWVSHTDPADGFWDDLQVRDALDRVDIPVLLLSGWQDLFIDQTIQQYRRLHERGVDVAMTIGPWTHIDMLSKGLGTVTRQTLDWLAEHLAGGPGRRLRNPVRVFTTGAGRWQDLPDWPPATSDQVLYLAPFGRLVGQPPPSDGQPSTFTYDPADPTPTVGGRLLTTSAGYRVNTGLEARPDVLTFTGPPLRSALDIVGSPVVELAHTSDNVHADVFVRLCEVDLRGVSRNVSDAFVRLDPGRGPEPLRLELDPIAHRFAAGSRLRLQVSGGCHPRYDRNLGTGEPPASGTRLAPSHRSIAHGDGGVSRVTLPIPTMRDRRSA